MKTKAQIEVAARQLPEKERIALAVDLWDSVDTRTVNVPDWHREVIRERVDALESQSIKDRSSAWEDVHQRVFSEDA